MSRSTSAPFWLEIKSSMTSFTPVPADIVDNKICLASGLFCRTNVVPCTTDCFGKMMKYKHGSLNFMTSRRMYEHLDVANSKITSRLCNCTLFPLEIRMFPAWDKYVVSSQPFASSPRSLNGTGYGTLNGRNFKVNAARSKQKRMRFPSSIVASACFYFQKMPHHEVMEKCYKSTIK